MRPDFAPGVDDLATIGDIVRRLDGLPLAIELAAPRARMFSLGTIAARLANRLDTLVGGPATVPDRQQNMRAAIAWSHELLDETARALFRRLAVFVGGWTVEAADAICTGPPVADVAGVLGTLVEQSLVQPTLRDGQPRFAMLETIREFAAERLDIDPDMGELHRRHRAFYLDLAEGSLENRASPERDLWFDRVEADLDSMLAAIDRAIRDHEFSTALGIAGALRPFWLERNHGGLGLATLTRVVDGAGRPDGADVARAAAAAAAIGTWLGDYAVARRLGALSVDAYRRLGDPGGFADAVGTLAFATIDIDPELALSLNGDSFEAYRATGDVGGQGQALLGRATAQFALGRLGDVRHSLERSVDLLGRAGDEYFGIFATVFLGRIKLLMGEVSGGLADYRAALERSRRLDLRLGIAVALDYLAEVAVWAEDLALAVRLAGAAERLKEELGGGVPPRMGGGVEALVVGRARLSPAAFEAARIAGRTTDLQSVIDEALAIEPSFGVPVSATAGRS